MADGEARGGSGGPPERSLQKSLRGPLNLALGLAVPYFAYKLVKGRSRLSARTVVSLAVAFLVYKKVTGRRKKAEVLQAEPVLPKLRKDFTVEELREYDGTGPDGRILVAVNGKVFDVTAGRKFYGPNGPYSSFGGRDASRGLATFSVTAKVEYDDLSDLNSMEMESVREWEMQFRERYEYVGRLLKPGEEPTDYSTEQGGESQQ